VSTRVIDVGWRGGNLLAVVRSLPWAGRGGVRRGLVVGADWPHRGSAGAEPAVRLYTLDIRPKAVAAGCPGLLGQPRAGLAGSARLVAL